MIRIQKNITYHQDYTLNISKQLIMKIVSIRSSYVIHTFL